MNRRLRLALAWLAAAVASGAPAAWPLREPPREVVVEGISRSEAREPSSPHATLGARAAASRGIERSEPAAGSESGTPAETPGEGGGSIDVTVVRSDGTPVEADVCAVPSNAEPARSDEDPPWPHAAADDRGHARIDVPAEGTYDVGAFANPAHGLVRDVRLCAVGATHVEVRLGALAAARVQAASPAASRVHQVWRASRAYHSAARGTATALGPLLDAARHVGSGHSPRTHARLEDRVDRRRPGGGLDGAFAPDGGRPPLAERRRRRAGGGCGRERRGQHRIAPVEIQW